MYVPSGDQADLKKRIADVQEIRDKHAKFESKTNVELRVLVNRLDKVIEKRDEDSRVIDELLRITKKLMDQYIDLEKKQDGAAKGLVELNARMDDLVRGRLDVAARLAAAKNRLDGMEKP